MCAGEGGKEVKSEGRRAGGECFCLWNIRKEERKKRKENEEGKKEMKGRRETDFFLVTFFFRGKEQGDYRARQQVRRSNQPFP